MSIATRKGDGGETDLLFGARVSKACDRIQALGEVDELNAALGLLRVHAADPRVIDLCAKVQLWLIGLMGELATPTGKEETYAKTHTQHVKPDQLEFLDARVAEFEAQKMTFKGWVLPGAAGSKGGAFADLARAVCRRAERAVVGLSEPLTHELPLHFLNRLSDVLWLAARVEDQLGAPQPHDP